MDTSAIKKEMLERIPELQRIKKNTNNDPEINAQDYAIYMSVESKIDEFFSEIVDSLFEQVTTW